MAPSIDQIIKGVSIVAQEYPNIKKAELFGSLARGQGRADSDVDLLIEFTTPQVSLLTLNGVKYRLEELLGSEVDVIHSPIPKDSLLEIDKRISVYGA